MGRRMYGVAVGGEHAGEYTRCRAHDPNTCRFHAAGSHEMMDDGDALEYNERVIAGASSDNTMGSLGKQQTRFQHARRRSLGARLKAHARRTIVTAIAVTCLFPALSACGTTYASSAPSTPSSSYSQTADGSNDSQSSTDSSSTSTDSDASSSSSSSSGSSSDVQDWVDKGKEALNKAKNSDTYQQLKEYASGALDSLSSTLDSYSSSGSSSGNTGSSVDGGSGSTSQYSSISKEEALAALQQVRVADADSSSYSRSDYKHWVSSTSATNNTGSTPSCMNVRNAIIARAGQDVQLSSDGCKVESATITDPYGAGNLSVSEVDIDHVVPLEYVNQHGGAAWSSQRKQDYANDMSQGHLLAVSSSANRQKGSKGPSEWMPAANQCEYAKDWAGTLQEWNITATQADWNTLNTTIQQCAA